LGAPVPTSILFTDDGKVGAQHFVFTGASCRPQSVGQNRKCDGISNTWKLTYPRLHQSAGNLWRERSNDLLFALPYQISPGLVRHVLPAGATYLKFDYPQAYSIAERGGCFQRRLFVCVFVCQSVSIFVRTITSERLKVGRLNLAVRHAVQKSRPSSKVKVKGQGHQGQKNEKLLSHPH